MTVPLTLTGATGFVGRRVLALAPPPVRALARQPQPATPGVEWVLGDLADTAALARLCDGAATVIHIAGVVNARNAAAFAAGNVEGTRAVLAAATAAGVRRFVHVSSLAAREPGLSLYGASKAEAERLVRDSALDWVIVRPPAVHGPADTEMLDLFRAAARGIGVAPGRGGRISIIHVDDLARALLALAGGGPAREVLEIDDGSGGYTHAAFTALLGQLLGTRPRLLLVPAPLLNAAAAVATLTARARGGWPKLTADRARYLAHPDWVARGGNARLAGLWAPQLPGVTGLADTAAGYRARGWL